MRITVLKSETLAGAKLSVDVLLGGNSRMVEVAVPGKDFSSVLARSLVQTGRK